MERKNGTLDIIETKIELEEILDDFEKKYTGVKVKRVDDPKHRFLLQFYFQFDREGGVLKTPTYTVVKDSVTPYYDLKRILKIVEHTYLSEKEEYYHRIPIAASCKDYAEIVKRELEKDISHNCWKPKLVVFQVDHNPASDAYIRGKKKDCEEVGIDFELVEIDSEKVDQVDFYKMIQKYKYHSESTPWGMIIQLPIPEKYDLDHLVSGIAHGADVDGFRKDSYYKPCTPAGIINWLKYNKVILAGKDICVVGRSEIVGKPLVNMLIDAGATVTCCNSRTAYLSKHTADADIVVTAIGKPKFFNETYFSKKTSLIIDVGINRDENGRLCGDVDAERVRKQYPGVYITPVPGGVGLLTRVQLLENVVGGDK